MTRLLSSFDSDNYNSSAATELPEVVTSYVEKRFRKCISVDKIKMFKDNPTPDTPVAKPPQLVDDIVAFLGNDFPTKSDKHLRMQDSSYNNSCSPPSDHLVVQSSRTRHGQSSNTFVPVEDVIDTIQHTISLLGNSVKYTSQARRDLIISQLEFKKKGLAKVMRKACQPDSAGFSVVRSKLSENPQVES